MVQSGRKSLNARPFSPSVFQTVPEGTAGYRGLMRGAARSNAGMRRFGFGSLRRLGMRKQEQ
jgi:hypothetical protein